MSDGQEIIFGLSILMGLFGLMHFAFGLLEKAHQRRRDEQTSRDQIEEIQADLRRMRDDIIRIGRGR